MKNQIDLDIILQKIKSECSQCNLKQKVNICQDCNFKYSRDGSFLREIKISKSHLFYFLYHPELNFKFPELPYEDYLGNNKDDQKQWRWELHHEDGKHWNDVEWNLILVLKTEHQHLHGGVIQTEEVKASKRSDAPGTKLRIEKQLITRRKNNTINIGCIKTKLTESQVIDIKKRLIDGERTIDISKEFNRGVTTIDNIKHGHSWKHIKI